MARLAAASSAKPWGKSVTSPACLRSRAETTSTGQLPASGRRSIRVPFLNQHPADLPKGMNHALMLNSSEGPRQDGHVKGIVPEGHPNRVGLGE